MNFVRNIVKNTGVMALGLGLNLIFTFILNIIYARYLGAIGFGKFAFALSFTALIAVLGDLGLATLAVRDIASDKSKIKKYLSNILTLKLIVSLVILILIFLIVDLLKYPKDTTALIRILGIYVVINLLGTGLRWVFQGYQVLEYESFSFILLGLLRLIGGTAILVAGYGIIELAWVEVIANLLILLFIFSVVRKKFLKINLELDFRFWKKLIKNSFPLALMVIFSTIYLNVDTVILSSYKGDEITGLYKAAYKLVAVIKLIPTFFIPAIFPVMAEFFSLSKEKFNRVGEKSLFFLILFGLPLSLSVTILSKKIILLLYGDKFVNSSSVLQILIWTSLFVFISQVMGYMLISAGKEKITTYIVAVGLFFNIFFNILLIPKYSYVGAAISIFIAELIVALLAYLSVYKLLAFKYSLAPYLKLLLSSLIMGVAVYCFQNRNLFFVIIIGVFVYNLMLFLIKGISVQDKETIKSILFKKNLI